MYYYAATRTPLSDLINDCIIQAYKVHENKTFTYNSSSFKNDCDVFNALHMMDNKEFFGNLKFGPGDGTLHYYIYNWQCPRISPEKVFFI